MHLIGLDIGTTGCKAALFQPDGTRLAHSTREYPILFPQPSWAEQDAEAVWALAASCLRDLAPLVTGDSALALSVQGEAIIPVDAAGTALRHALLGMDTRTNAENDWLRQRFGARWLFEHTGMPVHTINTLPKLLWLKRHEPAVWARADQFLLYEDFIICKLTGSAAISACLASRTQVYHTAAGVWSAELCAALELDSARLAFVHPSGSPVGRMIADLARALGFAQPPLIVTGGHDQACAALGVGLTAPGVAMVSTGTAEVVEVGLASLVVNDALYEANLSVYQHVVPGMYVAMTLNHSGGLLLRWFRDALCAPEAEAARRAGDDPYDYLLNGLSSELSSLLLLPHFAGSGTPTFDTRSKGALLGLTFQTDKREIAKAILEGLTFELRLNLDLLSAGGVPIRELRAVGGGARSAWWLQLKADVTGLNIVRPRAVDAACWGAALLAGSGARVITDLAGAAGRAALVEQVFTPEAARHERYETRYHLYRQVYPALAAIQHAL